MITILNGLITIIAVVFLGVFFLDSLKCWNSKDYKTFWFINLYIIPLGLLFIFLLNAIIINLCIL